MDIMKQIADEVADVVARVDEEQIKAALSLCTKERSILVTGEGRTGFVGRCFVMRLMQLGYHAYMIGETVVPPTKKGDLLVAISGSGTSEHMRIDVNNAVAKGADVLAITSKPGTPLAEQAAAHLVVPGTVKADDGETRGSIQLLSSLFDQSLHLVLDGICLLLSRRDDISNETATKNHW